MSDDHIHDWKPMEGEFNRYVCACGATGYRSRSWAKPEEAGKIVLHKDQRTYQGSEVTRKPAPGDAGRTGFGGRRIPRRRSCP